MRALLARIADRLRPTAVEPLRGPQAQLAGALTLSDHVVDRFRLRGPAPLERAREPSTLALRRLIAERGRVAERPPRWFGGRRSNAAFFIIIDERYVIPVAATRPGQLARRQMRPYVATTFVARDRRD